MSTFVNDEIEHLKKAKLEKFMKDAKKHKTGGNNIQNGKKQQQVEPQKAMPSPPMSLINAILTQAVTLSFDKETNDSNDILESQPFTETQLLDNALKLIQQVYPKLTEEQTKQVSDNLIRKYKQARYIGIIDKVISNGENKQCATKIALIYSNTLSFLPINDPFTQYAHYLELARNG